MDAETQDLVDALTDELERYDGTGTRLFALLVRADLADQCKDGQPAHGHGSGQASRLSPEASETTAAQWRGRYYPDNALLLRKWL